MCRRYGSPLVATDARVGTVTPSGSLVDELGVARDRLRIELPLVPARVKGEHRHAKRGVVVYLMSLVQFEFSVIKCHSGVRFTE